MSLEEATVRSDRTWDTKSFYYGQDEGEKGEGQIKETEKGTEEIETKEYVINNK